MTLDDLIRAGFDVRAISHALAILSRDFPDPLAELCEILMQVRISDEEIVKGGGGEAVFTQRLRRALDGRGWEKRKIEIGKTIDGVERSSISHEIDHFRKTKKGAVALEIEWNNKDPFFDRDLDNFQRLHGEGAISVGVIVTRGASMQGQMVAIVKNWAVVRGISSFEDLIACGIRPTDRQRRSVKAAGDRFLDEWSKKFVADKFGQATTHWIKLEQRIERGVGNPCPLLLIGLPASIIEATGPA